MDFIFGTLATDELKLVHHRAAHRGVQHAYRMHPPDPLPGEPVTLGTYTGADLRAQHVACYYTTDGSEPAGGRGVAAQGRVLLMQRAAVEWDTLTWGYLTHWQATLPALPEGTVLRYRIGAWSDEGDEVFANSPNATAAAEAAADAFFRGLPEPLPVPDDGRGNTFVVHIDRHSAPAWAKAAVIYHVFVDRFFPGRGGDWAQTSDLEGFCGGTLWGVLEKLDYIADLGATCIWLSPTWVSPTHHGYDVVDYTRTEPRLGGDAALRALVDAAHARGLRVLLDMVCNHIASDHPIFQDALHSAGSRYRDWFTFNDSPVGYRSFFNVPTMPQVNYANPAARAWMLDNARYWLREFKVDGYRLDYANGPGPDFWADFRAACRAENPEAFCFGEVVDAPDVLRTYAGRLDGVLDFHTGEALRKTFGWRTWTEADFERFADAHAHYFPADFVMPTFLDNHDMDRFLFIASGDKDALRRAAAVQMRLPGPPIIYYGTEIGLSQRVSTREGMGLHLSRTPMLWGDQQDADLLAYYRRLIAERRARG